MEGTAEARAGRAKQEALARVMAARERIVSLSHRIHAHPELGFEEHRASAWVAGELEAAGLATTRGAFDLPTSIRAQIGSGPLTVAICAEYDALPGVGHACGHNMIAAAAVAAARGLATLVDDLQITVVVLGTPAEEMSGGGKIRMLQRGAFAGVDAAMMVHPAPFEVAEPSLIASEALIVEYRGREAHAAAAPEVGMNAADAMVIAQAAIGLLRQQLPQAFRVHGIVTESGQAANIIPALSRARFAVRTPRSDQIDSLRERIARCFEAGALASGCTVEIRTAADRYLDLQHDREMAALYRANAESLGRRFSDQSVELQRFTPSTDMGNVSHSIPTIHPYVRVGSWPVVNHQPEFAAFCTTAEADEALLSGAVAMAWTAIDIALSPALRARLEQPGIARGRRG